MNSALPMRTLTTAAISATDETAEIVAAVSGRRIHVVAYEIGASGADATLVWKSGSSAISGTFDMQYADGVAASPCRNAHRDACIVTASGEALNATVTGTVTGYVTYYTTP